jgi:hypothetical protein
LVFIVDNNRLDDDYTGLEHEHELGINEPDIQHISNGIGQKNDALGKPIAGSLGTGIGPVGISGALTKQFGKDVAPGAKPVNSTAKPTVTVVGN